jgi:hypothetical protein
MRDILLEMGIRIKGPLGTPDQQLMEAAILHFILELPPERRPVRGDVIDVTDRMGGRIPPIPPAPKA